jgi:hypothetical protein
MKPTQQHINDHSAKIEDLFMTRRQMLQRAGMGFGAMSLAALEGMNLLPGSSAYAEKSLSPLAPKQPHFPVKAQRVIHIFAQGAPSHVDTWDPKPLLKQRHGQSEANVGGNDRTLMGSPFDFKPSGRSGLPVCEVFPNIGKHADDIAVIRSMHTNIPSHEVATVMMNTGSLRIIKPSLGSWVVYGLGSENQNLPGFISLRPGGNPPGASKNWNSAFLPGVYSGSSINTSLTRIEDMIANIKSPYTTIAEQRRQLDLIHKLNFKHSQNLQKEVQLESRLEAYEMAFKMQTEATDAFDISKEPENVRQRYGNSRQGRQMLIARRLLEKGVRFVQVWAGGWDHHNNLEQSLRGRATEIDGPAGALMQDLKDRGMMDSTLVMWGGEFGRTVHSGNNGNGRDHSSGGFCSWLAGGGVKGGTAYGATDEFGHRAVENKVHIHDLHATVMALLGFDHEKLTYRYNGRDFRLTDNFGNVVKDIIA